MSWFSMSMTLERLLSQANYGAVASNEPWFEKFKTSILAWSGGVPYDIEIGQKLVPLGTNVLCPGDII